MYVFPWIVELASQQMQESSIIAHGDTKDNVGSTKRRDTEGTTVHKHGLTPVEGLWKGM